MHAARCPPKRPRPRATTQSPIYGAITQNRIRSNKGRNTEREAIGAKRARGIETRHPRTTTAMTLLLECSSFRIFDT